MWKVPEKSLNLKLPQGFYLMEDEYFVHLFYEDEQIASFHQSAAHPLLIKAIAEAYMDKIMP